MKHLKAFIVLGMVLLPAGVSLRFAAAQGPGTQPSETVAKPKKKDAPPEVTDEPKIPSKFNKKDKDVPEGLPTFSSDVNTVQLDVAVLDNKGHFIPNIPRGNFRVLEDNVPQQISGFNTNADAPMTIAMVIEFNALFQQYWSQGWYETLVASYGFVQTLKPDDYVAIIAYDLRSEILSDFTTDREKIQEAMQRLRIPGFSESNMYDALVDTAQRMSNIEGRKAILLIATGRDTFSKLTYDKARKAIQEAGVPIYAISLLQALRIMAEPTWVRFAAHGFPASRQPIEYFHARDRRPGLLSSLLSVNSRASFRRYRRAAKSIFDRLQSFQSGKDGKFRKIKVELVDPDNGDQLRITDAKE